MQNLPDPTQTGNFSISNSSDDHAANADDNTQSQAVTPDSGTSVHKEVEPVKPPETSPYEETISDMEIAPELEQIGVEAKNETINLPPDIKKMGVEAIGISQPVMTQTVVLPISDDKIVKGLHMQVLSSLYWLALWCVRQLKKARINLRKISGNVVREGEK